MFKGKHVLVLAYVDELLMSCEDTALLYEMVEMLRAELKIKVTADLEKDGVMTFLGRKVMRSEKGGVLK